MLGQPYLASQGGELLVLGASKNHGWSSEAALDLSCLAEGDQDECQMLQVLRDAPEAKVRNGARCKGAEWVLWEGGWGNNISTECPLAFLNPLLS
jgi:hypothetical protein